MPNDPRPRRRSLRLAGYDYSQPGAYFITACMHNRAMLFGEVIDKHTGTIRWQRGYYKHVIRNEKALDRIRAYIASILRGGRTTQRTSRERFLLKQGGFETRPYKLTGHLRRIRQQGGMSA